VFADSKFEKTSEGVVGVFLLWCCCGSSTDSMSEQHAQSRTLVEDEFDEIEASFTEDINSEHNMDFLSAVNESPNEAHDMDHMPAAITQRLHPGSEFANPNEFFDIITQASIHTVRCFAMESILPVLVRFLVYSCSLIQH
jgi:hypothetical protein